MWIIPEHPTSEWSEHLALSEHGITKASLMALGIEHHHEGDDIVITERWHSLIHGLGFEITENSLILRPDVKEIVDEQISCFVNAYKIKEEEAVRLRELEEEQRTARIAAETAARQRGEDIAATEAAGQEAWDAIVDPGPTDGKAYYDARIILDNEDVDGSLSMVRKISDYKWEDAVPCRIGCRMGRPEKSAPREMKQRAHALYPIMNFGGPQRLLETAVSREGSIRVTVGPRRCLRCDKETPHLRCHHRVIPSEPKECGGRTTPADRRGSLMRNRQGELTTIPLADILEVKRIALGLDRLPTGIKAMKGLTSRAQTPEPIEKGILRAVHDITTFKDGTVRYDMIDVPVTHFRPKEIGTSVEKLIEMGYTHDCLLYTSPSPRD